MCGITAFSRAAETSMPDGRKMLVSALVAIEERGPDSTGVAWTRGRQEKVWYHKLVGRASRVAGRLDLDRKTPIRSAIGHTRWATQGAVNQTNAHPCVCEHIVLVHNGVITNDADLVALSGYERQADVDSWAISAVLAAQSKLGAEHPTELLELVEGDFALAWFNTADPGSLHLARGLGRPLTLGFTKRGDLIMSSTPETLRRTARLSGVDIGDVTNVEPGTYLRIVQGAIKEWRDFAPPRRATPVRRSPAPGRMITPRRGYAHGVTDLFDTPRYYDDGKRPSDWWDEAEKLLGKALDKDDDPAERKWDW